MIQELQPQLDRMKRELEALQASDLESDKLLSRQMQKTYEETLAQVWENITPSDRVFLARQAGRPNGRAFIKALFEDFVELHGDRVAGDDPTVVGGIALYHGLPVTVISLCKGESPEESRHYNYGMASPTGYRKVQRLAKQAEKFGRPVLCFIDTPGAYPGIEAEQQGQGEAIASCLALFSDLQVPVISTVTGEGGSGGALALAVANRVYMLENAIYSILSPEGFASILWKDAKRKEEAAAIMGLTAEDLLAKEVIDAMIPEGKGGIRENKEVVMKALDKQLHHSLIELHKMNSNTLCKERYERFRKLGKVQESPHTMK